MHGGCLSAVLGVCVSQWSDMPDNPLGDQGLSDPPAHLQWESTLSSELQLVGIPLRHWSISPGCSPRITVVFTHTLHVSDAAD